MNAKETPKKIILFCAANPQTTDRLALDKEARDIDEELRISDGHDSVELKTRWAVRTKDILRALNSERPTIFHFSGHGSGAKGVVLEDDDGGFKLVKAIALKNLFDATRDNVRVVVLNACYSAEQAEAIREVIDCVVGMSDTIGDKAARKFAAAFYSALGFGRSVKDAFKQGLVSIEMEDLGDENVPKLLVRAGVDPKAVFVVP